MSFKQQMIMFTSRAFGDKMGIKYMHKLEWIEWIFTYDACDLRHSSICTWFGACMCVFCVCLPHPATQSL